MNSIGLSPARLCRSSTVPLETAHVRDGGWHSWLQLFVTLPNVPFLPTPGHCRRRAGTAALVLGGLASGIALGTKPVGVVFVPPLLALVLGAKATRSRSTRKTLAAFFLILFCLLLTAGFWFGGNFLLTGNPLSSLSP